MGQWEGHTFCAICGYRDGLRGLVSVGCVCWGTHWTCGECRDLWLVAGGLEACPETDEFRVAEVLMADE